MPNQVDMVAGQILATQLIGNSNQLSRGYAVLAASDADQTLAAAVYQNLFIKLTGSWTGGHNVIVPTTTGGGVPYAFINATGQTMTVKTASGSGIAIANGKTAIVMEDGVNVVRVTADV